MQVSWIYGRKRAQLHYMPPIFIDDFDLLTVYILCRRPRYMIPVT